MQKLYEPKRLVVEAQPIIPPNRVNTARQGVQAFTPDAAFTGVMSFKYKIQDAQGNTGVVGAGTGGNIEATAQVILRSPDVPRDAGFVNQKYINLINVLPVWKDYTGKGVSVGVFEPGSEYAVEDEVFDYRHPDLSPNVDPTWLAQGKPPTTFSQHATVVAGVIAAARNGEGAVGIAYGATIAGQSLGDGTSLAAIDAGMARFKEFDVVNNSWGADNFSLAGNPSGALHPGIYNAVSQGRAGLGTVLVFGAGNSRALGDNTNYSLVANTPVSITVGGISTPNRQFSTPGASILVSAPAFDILSTSREVTNSEGSVLGSDYVTAEGTSLAAPIVSGVRGNNVFVDGAANETLLADIWKSAA